MFSQQLKRVEKIVFEFLEDEHSSVDCDLNRIKYNGFDALLLTFEKHSDVMVFVDNEDDMIDIANYGSNNLTDSDYIDGCGVEYIEIPNIVESIKYDIENISNEIENNELKR